MTFKEFMNKQNLVQDAASDFIRDALADGGFPDVTNWVDLHDYLVNREACDGAVAAGRAVWMAYRNSR